jgi:dephospho-CoA kinase
MGKIVLGIVGEKFAGKDVMANYLAEKHKATHIRFSHIFDEILNLLCLPISRENEINLGNGIRSKFGEDVFVPAVLKRVKDSTSQIVAVNGIRLNEEYEALKNLGAKFIYVTAPMDLRFERYLQRREKADDAKLNFEDFKLLEETHTEHNIPVFGNNADFKIQNVGSLQDFYVKIEAVLSQLTL